MPKLEIVPYTITEGWPEKTVFDGFALFCGGDLRPLQYGTIGECRAAKKHIEDNQKDPPPSCADCFIADCDNGRRCPYGRRRNFYEKGSPACSMLEAPCNSCKHSYTDQTNYPCVICMYRGWQ